MLSDEYSDYADSHAEGESQFPDYIESSAETDAKNSNLNAKVFENPSPQFLEAIEKISPELLRLMRTQFHSEPLRFVEDGIEIRHDENKPSEAEESENFAQDSFDIPPEDL